jgi:hypothetical protein
VDRLAALAGDGQALEFAIGTGRVAIPLAERGVPVTGIELSGPMIEQLRTKADQAAIPVIAGDMATPGPPARTRSSTSSTTRSPTCSPRASRWPASATPPGTWSPAAGSSSNCRVPEVRTLPPGQQATVWKSEPSYIGLDTNDVLHQRVVSDHFTFGTGDQARLSRSPHRYIWPSELDLMAQLAGFELEARHADWAGAEFTAESRSHVSVYRLPAS